ncbi:hypothetical protein [Sphaerisporangium dianthi]|uniref:DUF2178 domain-containing protein n=1 Tax=Sphaerisporangium dianthi TaxID=1436120 RepID=A0ABV9C7Y8_9ACTN
MSRLNETRINEARRGIPFFWYGTRRGRRTAVALGAVAVGTLYVDAVLCWFTAPSDTAMWTTFGLTALGLVVYAWAFAVLLVASGGAVGLTEDKLDERQLAERQRVRALAHRGTGWMLWLSTILVFNLPVNDDHMVRLPALALSVFVFGLFTTHLILPHLIAGWRLPDPMPEEDDELTAAPSGNGTPA